ncbi:hypothetical protein [Candidatus Pyrohabitans sp.]
MEIEKQVVDFLEKHGPALGGELYESLGIDSFQLWRTCMLSNRIVTRHVGRRYLRLDKRVEGYARLSPSIQREFLTYTVVGLKEQESEVIAGAALLEKHIAEISKRKLRLAKRVVEEALERLGSAGRVLLSRACFLIGGDVPLGMAHSDARPERSTGELVAGSDLDLVVILGDEVSEELEKKLDDALFEIKHRLLAMPRKEELDYLIKRWSRAVEQLNFASFEDMVACKIFNEAELLAGSKEMFSTLKREMRSRSVVAKLRELEARAIEYRRQSEKLLLAEPAPSEELLLRTFTTTIEASEIF